MSIRDSSYSMAFGPCVVAQLPSEDPQNRDHGFLRPKIKVLTLALTLRTRAMCVALWTAQETWHR